VPDSYKDLVNKAKAGQIPDGVNFAQMTGDAVRITQELKMDLKSARLTDTEYVRQLLEAKFRESTLPDVQLRQEALSVVDFIAGSGKTHLAGVIIGINPGGAFNVSVVYTQGKVVAYFWQVPHGGNPRS
jgi:hypothetical protein